MGKDEVFISNLSTYIISHKYFKTLNKNRVSKAHTWNIEIINTPFYDSHGQNKMLHHKPNNKLQSFRDEALLPFPDEFWVETILTSVWKADSTFRMFSFQKQGQSLLKTIFTYYMRAYGKPSAGTLNTDGFFLH